LAKQEITSVYLWGKNKIAENGRERRKRGSKEKAREN
jgi:hypothetical protein